MANFGRGIGGSAYAYQDRRGEIDAEATEAKQVRIHTKGRTGCDCRTQIGAYGTSRTETAEEAFNGIAETARGTEDASKNAIENRHGMIPFV